MSHTPPPQPGSFHRIPWLYLLLSMSLVLCMPRTASATIDTVYVDNTKACPGGPGTSLSNAYCSIVTALANTGGADKVVAVVGTGQPYRESGTVSIAPDDSGTVGQPFVLMARGTVVLDCADTTSRWTAVPGTSTMWRAPGATSPTSAAQVYLTGVPYPYLLWPTALADLPAGRCFLAAGVDSIYVNFGSHPNWGTVDPTATVAYVTYRKAIEISGSNVTVQGFTVRRASDDGIRILGTVRNVTIANCDVRASYRQGIMPSNSASHHCTIRDNIASENGRTGIYISELNTDYQILRNTCAYNADFLAYNNPPPNTGRSSENGLRIGDRGAALGSPILHNNHLVEANIAHHNQDTGIEIRSNYTLLRYNQSWSNQDHGFDHLYSTNNTHVGDLAWGNNRDGMSFENHSHNHEMRNCVISNNGRDRTRNDAELEFDNSAIYNLTSDYNVIWRDFTAEPADSIILNLKGGTCSGADSCFGTLARFQSAFNPLEAHSRSGQPTYADSGAGNFIPTSSSSVLDAGNSAASGYHAFDVRGYYRHDAQAKEPNTGTGEIDYADIGPYEWDVAEAPTAPDLTCYKGRYDAAVTWYSTQYNGDASSRYEVLIGGFSYGGDAASPPGSLNCVHVTPLTQCSHYTFTAKITDVNTGYYSSSTCTLTTKCSGSTYVECADGLVAGGGDDESFVAELEGSQSGNDEPSSLDLRIATLGTSRAVLYSVPKGLADLPFDLGVFDVAGRLLMRVAQGPSRVGRFSAALSRSSPGLGKAGVYYVRMRVGDKTLRKSVVLW